MTHLIFNRFLPGLTIYFAFLFTIMFQTATAQVCDKKTMVFFDSDKYDIKSTEEQKLRILTNQFSQKTDTFLLEIYAFTDSVASVEYNYRLATNRFKSIVTYLKKNSAAHLEIIEKVRGEATPLKSNATEEGRAKNRRVEIFYWKNNGGLVTLKGKGGMEVSLKRDFFGPCGICGCNTRLTEIYTNEQANSAGISLTTIAGCPLITGGMLSINFDGQDSTRCRDVKIRIPASQYDEDMEIWNAGGLNSRTRWSRDSNGQLEFDEVNKVYTMVVRLCPGASINLDKVTTTTVINDTATTATCRDSTGVIAVPELKRPKRFMNFRITKSTVLSRDGKKTITMAKFPYRGRGQVFFVDSGISQEKIGYYFAGVLDPFVMECDTARCSRLKECWCYEIPLSAYTRLVYFDKKKNYRLKVPFKYRNYALRLFIPGADTIIQVNKIGRSKRKYNFQQPLPNTYVVLYKKGSDANNKRAYDYQVDLEKVRKKYNKRKNVYKAKIKRGQLKH